MTVKSSARAGVGLALALDSHAITTETGGLTTMEWRVARSLDVLLGQLNTAFPGRSKASDGSIGDAAHQTSGRASDHNPWYGPGIVTARDFTHDPAVGMDIDRITDELEAMRDPRIKYIIANGLILDSRPGHYPWQWRPYSGGANPHTKHFHLSVMDSPICDDSRPWDLPSFRQEDDMPSPTDLWNHPIDDPYVGPDGKPRARKPAHVLLSHGSANAAYAKEQADTVRAELAALKAALPGMVAEEVRTALAQGVLDVDITVRDRTTETA